MRIALGGLALIALAGRYVGALLSGFTRCAEDLWGLGALAFTGADAVLVVALVSGFALILAAGAIFEFTLGAAIVFVGATVGATAAFLVSRYFVRI